ncbi:MAG: gliding motility-associated C-terminal domain-containing protein [Bacteroidales bacterium]|nr:gliding motility-associated C-terminal domain-containing protein [Bacteroidales bacterium]
MNIKRTLMILVALLSLAARGQCVFPLPYTTDLMTGFQPPEDPHTMVYPWVEGVNIDNCWTGYLDFGGDDTYDPLSDVRYSARGRFGYWYPLDDGGQWSQEAEIAVKDTHHNGTAMLIAPRFVSTPEAVRMTVKLQRYIGGSYIGDALFWAKVDVGWVTDVLHPNASFLQTGTFAIQSQHLLDTSWHEYCLPVPDAPPAGGRFALRLRSKANGPAQNLVPITHFYYEFMFRRIVMDTAVCQPPHHLSTDTVYVSDSVCQHSPYAEHGIFLSAAQTADTGVRTFVLHSYEYLTHDSCLCHVKVLTLTVLPSDITSSQDSIFPGEAYTFGGRELTLAGTYVDDHGPNAYGCPQRDSLALSIRPLPPMPCGAEIEVDRTEYYLTQPAEVHLWTESEGTRYLWNADSLAGDSTQRDAHVVLQPDSEQRVRLEVERLDTVNHIYRGASVDTSFYGVFQLTVPVEPQTRYLLEAVVSDSVGLTVQEQAPDELSWADSLLRATFSTGQSSTVTLLFHATSTVQLSPLSLRRYCLSVDTVLLVAHHMQPAIVPESDFLCLGDSLVLRGAQTDTCRWASSPHDAGLDSQQGRVEVVVSPTVTTTYYLLWPSGQVADSLTVQVLPPPRMLVVADREIVNFDNPVLILEVQSEEIVLSRWTFSDGNDALGRQVKHRFDLDGNDSVWVLVEGCSAEDCCADTMLRFSVGIISAWFPNVFTPGADNNNCFGLMASVEVVEYEMFIYNRLGLLVYHSNDPAARWDGRDSDGNPCKQEVYTYLCNYCLMGDYRRQQVGTVLLLR